MNTDFISTFKQNIQQTDTTNFEQKALFLFRFQALNNPVYAQYIQLLNRVVPTQVQRLEDIPFLPIELFKHHTISVHEPPFEQIFESSATTGQQRSRHYVKDALWYKQISQWIFEQQYGSLKNYIILALLPSYLERNNASLVYMLDHFIQQTQHPASGFYLHDTQALIQQLRSLKQQIDKKILLIGVTFALLDLAQELKENLSPVIVMETGGMKGRRAEMLRAEVHHILRQTWQLPQIHSEYGMTELLSQAYSQGQELFKAPPTMHILLRDKYDFFDISPTRKRGLINIIDLANVDSCAFIATEDIGEQVENNYFKVIGRNQQADIRGCNLMVAEV